MTLKSRTLRFSVPRGLGKEFEALAKEVGKSKGELLREMMAVYKARQEGKEVHRLQRRYARQISRSKPLTEKEIDRIVFKSR